MRNSWTGWSPVTKTCLHLTERIWTDILSSRLKRQKSFVSHTKETSYSRQKDEKGANNETKRAILLWFAHPHNCLWRAVYPYTACYPCRPEWAEYSSHHRSWYNGWAWRRDWSWKKIGDYRPSRHRAIRKGIPYIPHPWL